MDTNDTDFSNLTSAQRKKVSDVINRSREMHQTTHEELINAANSTEFALASQLILLNTVVITGVLVSLGTDGFYTIAGDYHRVLLFGIFILQLISITAGIRLYISDRDFFNHNARISAQVVKYINDRKYRTVNQMNQGIRKRRKDAKKTGNKSNLRVQISTLFLSLLLFAALMIGLFFFPDTKSIEGQHKTSHSTNADKK